MHLGQIFFKQKLVKLFLVLGVLSFEILPLSGLASAGENCESLLQPIKKHKKPITEEDLRLFQEMAFSGLKRFLFNAVPLFSGQEEFFQLVKESSEFEGIVNKILEKNKAFLLYGGEIFWKEGKNFVKGYHNALLDDFSDDILWAIDPVKQIDTLFKRFQKSHGGLLEEQPIRSEKAERMAKEDTMKRFMLSQDMNISNLPAEADWFYKRRYFKYLISGSQLETNGGGVDLWIDHIIKKLNKIRLINLNLYLRMLKERAIKMNIPLENDFLIDLKNFKSMHNAYYFHGEERFWGVKGLYIFSNVLGSSIKIVKGPGFRQLSASDFNFWKKEFSVLDSRVIRDDFYPIDANIEEKYAFVKAYLELKNSSTLRPEFIGEIYRVLNHLSEQDNSSAINFNSIVLRNCFQRERFIGSIITELLKRKKQKITRFESEGLRALKKLSQKMWLKYPAVDALINGYPDQSLIKNIYFILEMVYPGYWKFKNALAEHNGGKNFLPILRAEQGQLISEGFRKWKIAFFEILRRGLLVGKMASKGVIKRVVPFFVAVVLTVYVVQSKFDATYGKKREKSKDKLLKYKKISHPMLDTRIALQNGNYVLKNFSKKGLEKAKKKTLFHVRSNTMRLENIPTYFTMVTKKDISHRNSRVKFYLDNIYPIDGNGFSNKQRVDFWINSTAEIDDSSGIIPIPSPNDQDYQISAVRIMNEKSNHFYSPKDVRFVLMHSKTGYFLKRKPGTNMRVDTILVGYSKVKSSKKKRRFIADPLTSTSVLRELTEELRRGGFSVLAKALKARMELKKTINILELAKIFENSAIYSYQPSSKKRYSENGPFDRFKRFLKHGRMYCQCNAASALFVEFLNQYFKRAKINKNYHIQAKAVGGFLRSKKSKKLTLGDAHLFVRVYWDNPKKSSFSRKYFFEELDVTPGVEESSNKDNVSPPVPPPPSKKQDIKIIAILQKKKVLKEQGGEEESELNKYTQSQWEERAFLQDFYVQQLINFKDQISKNSFIQKIPVRKLKGLVIQRAYQLSSVFENFKKGLIRRDQLKSRFEKIYPFVKFLDVDGDFLSQIDQHMKRIIEYEKDLIDKARKRFEEGKMKKWGWLINNDILLDSVMDIFVLLGDVSAWKPVEWEWWNPLKYSD